MALILLRRNAQARIGTVYVWTSKLFSPLCVSFPILPFVTWKCNKSWFLWLVLKLKFGVPPGTGFVEWPAELLCPQTYILFHLSNLLSQCWAKPTFPSLSTWLWSCGPFRSHDLAEIGKSGPGVFRTNVSRLISSSFIFRSCVHSSECSMRLCTELSLTHGIRRIRISRLASGDQVLDGNTQ